MIDLKSDLTDIPDPKGARAISATTAPARAGLNTPYGGTLVDLIVDDARAAEMKADGQGPSPA